MAQSSTLTRVLLYSPENNQQSMLNCQNLTADNFPAAWHSSRSCVCILVG